MVSTLHSTDVVRGPKTVKTGTDIFGFDAPHSATAREGEGEGESSFGICRYRDRR